MQPHTFHSLYENHAEHVRRFVYWLTGSEDEAEEVTSETFLRAWTAKSEVRASTARAYLLAIARNLVADERRRNRRTTPLELTIPDRTADVEQKVEVELTIHKVRNLKKEYSVPLLLYAAGGLTYDEIAQQLQLSVATVKVRIHRARLMLVNKDSEGTKWKSAAK